MNMQFIYRPEGFYHSKTVRKEYNIDYIQNAIKRKFIMESKAIKLNTSNELILAISDGVIGLIQLNDFEDIEESRLKLSYMYSKVGMYIKYIPQEILEEPDENGNTIVICSRRESQKQCKEKYISTLKPGDIINARIMNLHNKSIFCDIGCGVPAILPIDSYCVARLVDPVEDLRGIREIKAIVCSIKEDGSIFLSHKELLGTWYDEVQGLSVGDTVIGTISKIESFGAFVTLSPNLFGLANKSANIKEGDTVYVSVKAIVPEKMKVKLIIKSVQNNADGLSLKPVYKIKDTHVDYWKYSPDEYTGQVIERKFTMDEKVDE